MIVFKRTTSISVILVGHFQRWIRQWSQLSTEEERALLKEGCGLLEIMMLDFFNKFGWRNRNRIEA